MRAILFTILFDWKKSPAALFPRRQKGATPSHGLPRKVQPRVGRSAQCARLLAAIACASSVATAATVYKWVDDNGVIHFSDQPHENAEKVQLKAPQTYAAPKTPNGPSQPSRDVQSGKPAKVYQSCSLSEPANDQVYMNTDTVTAGVATQPSVRTGDTAIVTLDGQRVPGVPPSGGQFTISPIDRGTHLMQVTIVDSNGATVCSGPAVTFHVRQPSLLSPTQPVKPH